MLRTKAASLAVLAAIVSARAATAARADARAPEPRKSVFQPADEDEGDDPTGAGGTGGRATGAGGTGGQAPAEAARAAPLSPAEQLRKRAAAFARFRTTARASAESVGAYANGCLLGGMALPPSGPGFEVLHLDRHRRFGHPALVAYIRRLAQSARKAGLGPLLIGDLSQPRGGPTPYGHRSHQSGLDVDIGFTQQSFLRKRPPNKREREELMPPVVLDLKTRKLTSFYSPKVDRLIELAARDPAIDRVFVNPHIKHALCKRRWKDRAFLRMVRPWTYHHDHLHARLKCPLGSPDCESQATIAPGDGCDDVERAVAEEERRAREPPPPPPPPPPVPPEPRPPRLPPPLPPFPEKCQALIQEATPVATRPLKVGSTARNP